MFSRLQREEEVPIANKPRRACLYVPPPTPGRGFEVNFLFIRAALFPGGSWQMKIIYKELVFAYSLQLKANSFYQALISTSTPDGRSNLLSASTVLEEEV